MSSKDELKRLKKELEDKCISLTKFLINYCGIYNEDIHNIKISHQDIKELIPTLKRISFDSLLKNNTSFYTGDIIPVKDCYGNIVPYINPMLEINNPIEIDCEKIKEDSSIEFNNNLKKFELIKLCRFLKHHHRFKEYRSAHKQLLEKKDMKVKEYKKRKNNLKMKGREENEEY